MPRCDLFNANSIIDQCIANNEGYNTSSVHTKAGDPQCYAGRGTQWSEKHAFCYKGETVIPESTKLLYRFLLGDQLLETSIFVCEYYE